MTINLAPERSGALPKVGRGQGWRRREAELIARVDALIGAASGALGAQFVLPVVNWPGPWRSAEVVAELTGLCLQRLRRTAERDTETIRRLCGLVIDLNQLALDLSLYELGLRTRRLADCSAGLNRLRALPGSTDVLEQVCEEVVRRCGFGRAVLSRVSGGSWKPWLGFFSDDAEFDSWFTDWIDQGIPLDGHSPEKRMLTERRPTLVYDTETAPVHRPIIVDSGRSRSYVVAPILRGGDVVGFLHADHHPLHRRADEADRDVLWAFAEGFGHIYERTLLLERLRAQRDQVRDVLFSAVESMNELCESSIDLARERGPEHAGPPGRMPVERLTAREGEVFELMAAGASNGAIAEQLFITGDTVKSHVKHILRKLGAANRAEAVSKWLQEGNSPAGTPMRRPVVPAQQGESGEQPGW